MLYSFNKKVSIREKKLQTVGLNVTSSSTFWPLTGGCLELDEGCGATTTSGSKELLSSSSYCFSASLILPSHTLLGEGVFTTELLPVCISTTLVSSGLAVLAAICSFC